MYYCNRFINTVVDLICVFRYYAPDHHDLDTKDKIGDIEYIKCVCPTALTPTLAPGGGSVLDIYAFLRPTTNLAHWQNEKVCQQFADRLVNIVQRSPLLSHSCKSPSCSCLTLGKDTVVRRVNSPLFFNHHPHLLEGAIGGVITERSEPANYPRRIKEVNGLYLTGQPSILGGVASAAMSGLFTAADVVLDSSLLAKLKTADQANKRALNIASNGVMGGGRYRKRTFWKH